ncbi:uncharacterized protein K444DRAFT_223059 [Hyaloscypha bicolor E]|uniref:Uncharacterized protein n=1 Tax=Hyaloscypha bicolor E TaxID=1095630 RepID=A0A2J6SJQ8_9HELO|nr:uncharacterized protein K444DRAFT_223059 [Hyaloscypha bicolor E]PMD51008.1 hypothetical protein K444DRAFT_223059 [Hyaloscypha bicolor E]
MLLTTLPSLGKRSRSSKIRACFWFQVCSSQRCRVSILSPPRAMGRWVLRRTHPGTQLPLGAQVLVYFRILKWDYVQSHRSSDDAQPDTLVSRNDSSTSSVEHFTIIGECFFRGPLVSLSAWFITLNLNGQENL